MVGDVLGELFGAHEARELEVSVGLAGLFGVSGVLHHGDTVLNLFHVQKNFLVKHKYSALFGLMVKG